MLYDIHGNSINAYDIHGHPLEHTLIHHTISASLPAQYGDNISTQYNGFKNAYEAHPTAIPFFVVTDQHGVGLGLLRYVNNLDTRDKLNFYKFQLGDYCYDNYTTSAMAELLRNSKDIDGYLSVPGNHDYKNSAGEYDSATLLSSFVQDVAWYACRWADMNYKCYTALDMTRNLKIILADPYDLRGFISGMAHPWYNKDYVDWLIDEMTNDGGMDILFVQHEPIYDYSRNRSSETRTEYTNTTARFIRPLIVARKKKQSGTFTDKEGYTHSYDFRNCEGELLMTLHGHTHAERWDIEDFTCLTLPNGYNGAFGLIDKANSQLHIWRFSYDSCPAELIIPLT